MNNKKIDLPIIIPAHNEEDNIDLLFNNLNLELTKLSLAYELIFVDDGSTDKTLDKIKKIIRNHNFVKLVNLQAHYGKASALQAGFDLARGKLIITMDADLQDDPQELKKFIKLLKEDFDLVCGWKQHRNDPLNKILASKFANFVTSFVTGMRLHDMNCGYKGFKRKVLENLNLYGELHRYIPVLVSKKGFKITEVKVKHHPRRFGKSKYGFERFLRSFFDLITVYFLTKFKSSPLHFFGSIGLLSGFSDFLIALYLTIIWFQGESIGKRPILQLAVLLMFLGAQFFSIGLIGELLINHDEKKHYIIKEIIR